MPSPGGTRFAVLVSLVQNLEGTSKRLEKRRLIAEFLPSVQRVEVSPAVLLIVSRIFPEVDSKALNVGWATLKKALGSARQARLDARPPTLLDAPPPFP